MSENGMEKPNNEEDKDPLESAVEEVQKKFAQDAAARDAVLKEVGFYLKGDDKLKLTVEQMQARIEMHERNAKQSKTTMERILEQLPTNEQVAFKLALAKSLEELYYHHYDATLSRKEKDRN